MEWGARGRNSVSAYPIIHAVVHRMCSLSSRQFVRFHPKSPALASDSGFSSGADHPRSSILIRLGRGSFGFARMRCSPSQHRREAAVEAASGRANACGRRPNVLPPLTLSGFLLNCLHDAHPDPDRPSSCGSWSAESRKRWRPPTAPVALYRQSSVTSTLATLRSATALAA